VKASRSKSRISLLKSRRLPNRTKPEGAISDG
jgi:hypothetical protein